MGRLIAKILAWLAILLGLALLIQPTAAQWWTSTRNAKTAAQFAARAEAQPTAPAAEETTAEPPEPERAYPELYAAMQDYNAEIYAGGQSGLTDPFAYEEAPLDLAAYGYDDDVLAVLWIPRLNLELPVYLGSRPRKPGQRRGAAGPDLDAAGRRKHQHRDWPPTAAIRARKCCATCSRSRWGTRSS